MVLHGSQRAFSWRVDYFFHCKRLTQERSIGTGHIVPYRALYLKHLSYILRPRYFFKLLRHLLFTFFTYQSMRADVVRLDLISRKLRNQRLGKRVEELIRPELSTAH